MLTVISASWGLVHKDDIISLAKYKCLVNFGFASTLRMHQHYELYVIIAEA